MHLCSRKLTARNDKKDMNKNAQNEKNGKESILLLKLVHYVEALCTFVKGSTVNSLAVAIIQIAKVQEKLIFKSLFFTDKIELKRGVTE